MSRRIEPTCHHYCNNELTCPECVRRFWKWAEMHTRGRQADPAEGHGQPGVRTRTTFYEAAAMWIRP